MQRKSFGDLEYLVFDHLSECPNVVHGTFLKKGGVSEGPFSSLNFGITQGDSKAHVQENKRRALEALGLHSFSQLLQVHGKKVVTAQESQLLEGDGLITDQRGLGLMILHADCQAAIFYDPIHHALANVHAGWRGSVQNIYAETVVAMKERFGSSPQNLLVGISPSLGPNVAEFINYKTELPQAFWPFQIKPTYFDFWQISRWQLEGCGVLPHHIEIAELCTYSQTDDFFSYRRVKASGRHATLASLK